MAHPWTSLCLFSMPYRDAFRYWFPRKTTTQSSFPVLCTIRATVARAKAGEPFSNTGAFESYSEIIVKAHTPLIPSLTTKLALHLAFPQITRRRRKRLSHSPMTARLVVVPNALFVVMDSISTTRFNNKKDAGMVGRRMGEKLGGRCCVSFDSLVRRPCLARFSGVQYTLKCLPRQIYI